LEAFPGVLEFLGVLEAFPGVLEAFPGVLEAFPFLAEVFEARPARLARRA